jgi:hypothetical protein
MTKELLFPIAKIQLNSLRVKFKHVISLLYVVCATLFLFALLPPLKYSLQNTFQEHFLTMEKQVVNFFFLDLVFLIVCLLIHVKGFNPRPPLPYSFLNWFSIHTSKKKIKKKINFSMNLDCGIAIEF